MSGAARFDRLTAGLYFEGLEIGDEIGPVERVVRTEQVREFVKIWGAESGPSRFTDVRIATKEGLPGPIVPGAMNMAMMSQIITDWSPTVTLKKLDVIFRQVVLHNAPLRLQGIVTDKTAEDGEPRIECDVWMEDTAGVRLVIARATAVLPMRGRHDPLSDSPPCHGGEERPGSHDMSF